MGVVLRQSVQNTAITYLGFIIGAVNALFLYTHFLGKTFYGLTAFLLSSANVIMPLMAFGVHNTLVKFYSTYSDDIQRSRFLTLMLILPLLLIVPVILVGWFFYPQIAVWLSENNIILHDYVWLIPIIGFGMGYFEIFYAWVKVHMKSVFGNLVREVILRLLASILLFMVYFKILSPTQFVYALTGSYLLAMFIMAFVAFKVHQPVFEWKLPNDTRHVLSYSFFILLSGSVAVLLLDIDKTMLGKYMKLENVAFYSVAIFMATVVAVPSRAMHQITYPITAKLMAQEKLVELNLLYKKSSITLQVAGGYVLLGILTNLRSIYALLPEEYAGGVFVVFAIGISKYFDLMLGNNNAIIFNSKYYKTVLALGLLLGVLAVAFNIFAIPRYGINGAATATLLAVFLYSLAKLIFVIQAMKLYPFSRQTLYMLLFSGLTFLLFYYWDFPVHPVLAIGFKSFLLTAFYFYFTIKFNISKDVNQLFDKFVRKLRR
jgi:O-antigen/teichoic acid export membrane protein